VAVPRLISPDDEAFIVATAAIRPEKLGQPFTRWSIRKLTDYLAHNRGGRRVRIDRERLRQLLHKHEITFQRTKTWKESTDPDRDAKLARIEHVTTPFRLECSRSTSSARSRSVKSYSGVMPMRARSRRAASRSAAFIAEPHWMRLRRGALEGSTPGAA
jgi:hypothetical protein